MLVACLLCLPLSVAAAAGHSKKDDPLSPDHLAPGVEEKKRDRPETEAEPPAGATEDGEPNEHEWDERVAVRARIEGSDTAPLGANSTLIDPQSGLPSAQTITDLVAEVPGVSQNGQGGSSQTYSIRGVSRQRILSLIDGMRITSERRAGVSTSFIDPLLLGSIEVLRGPATTFYGSGALGGVVQSVPRVFTQTTFAAGFQENGTDHFAGFGVGGASWSLGLVQRQAGMSTAADGSTLNSAYTRWSASFLHNWKTGKREYQLLVLPALAEDIGKSNSDPSRETVYPRERHQLIKFSVTEGSHRRYSIFVHHQDLQTRVVDYTEPELSQIRNDSLDFGLNFEDRINISPQSSLRFGADFFARNGVDSEEWRSDLDPVDPEPTTQTRSLDGGAASGLGAFAALRWNWAGSEWEAGGRTAWQRQENTGSPRIDRSAVSGFIGAVRGIGEHWQLRGSLSSGLRFPSISELFYSGTTGRGQVIGNPDLVEERSFNAELALRWLSRELMIDGSVFRTAIDDYIERIELTEDLLTFNNISGGTISGIELHGLISPGENWIVALGGHLIEGRSDAAEPLADVPADGLYVALDHRHGRWSYDLRLAHRFPKNDPGSGEKAISSADILSGAVRVTLTDEFQLSLTGSNLLNEDYFPSADRKAAPATGRSIGLQLHWSGR